MRLRNSTMALAGAMVLVSSTAFADVLVTDSHTPLLMSKKNQLVRDCVTAIRNHWKSDGLVLEQRARYGTTADGVRVVTVAGTIWKDGERAGVSHQCSDRLGPNRLALNVEFVNQVATVQSNRL